MIRAAQDAQWERVLAANPVIRARHLIRCALPINDAYAAMRYLDVEWARRDPEAAATAAISTFNTLEAYHNG